MKHLLCNSLSTIRKSNYHSRPVMALRDCVPAVGQYAAASPTRLFINKSANGHRNRRRIPRHCSSVIAFPFGSRVAARKDTEELYSIFRAGGLRTFFEFIRFPVSLAAAKFRFHRRNFFGNHFQRVGRELRVHRSYPRNSRTPRSLFVFMLAIAKFSGFHLARKASSFNGERELT